MKILIVSGFLGAGKTTFIQEMSRTTGKSFVIYENEYGDIGIDSQILKSGPFTVWDQVGKCVCCSGSGDLSASILAISGALDPEYLIVEPTGTAFLSAIIENISGILYEKISLLPPVSIVDAENFRLHCEADREILYDQIRSAGVIFLSKTSNVYNEEIEEIKGIIKSVNGSAGILSGSFSGISEECYLSLLEGDGYKNGPTEGSFNIHTDPPDEITFRDLSLPTPVHLFALLDLTAAGAFGKIARAKGILPCGSAGERLRFDLVGRRWAVTGSCEIEDGASSAVFIGRNIDRDALGEAVLYGRRVKKISYPGI